MPDIDQLEQQVAYLTEALKRLREGKFDGAEGVDAMIVALQGGQPLDFQPSWPGGQAASLPAGPEVGQAASLPAGPEVGQASSLPAGGTPASPTDEQGRLIQNGAYWSDPNFEADLDRYGARIAQLLSPAIASFARAQARVETGNGQLFSTPYNFGNIGNTDDNPKGGGGFPNPEAAAEAWVAFISNNGGPTRYQPFLDAGLAGAGVAALAQLIKAAGYATDPDYAAKVASYSGT